jgi:hypothetical protein
MDTKKCTRCGLAKPLDEYHVRNSRPLGRASECNSCFSLRQFKYRREHAEQQLEYEKQRKQAAGEEYLEQARRYKEGHVEGEVARHAAGSARRTGRLVPKACWCAAFSGGVRCHGRTEGHHEDYAKPLEVIWLCQSHHQRLHAKRHIRERRRAARTAATPSTG